MINTELSRVPMVYMYENALVSYRKISNQITRPYMSTNKRTRRSINGIQQGGPGSGCVIGYIRGKGYYDGIIQGIGCGRGNNRQTRMYSSIIKLANGQKIDYHLFKRFPPYIYQKIKEEEKQHLLCEQ